MCNDILPKRIKVVDTMGTDDHPGDIHIMYNATVMVYPMYFLHHAKDFRMYTMFIVLQKEFYGRQQFDV